MHYKGNSPVHQNRVEGFLDKQLGSSLFTSKKIFQILLPLIIDQLFINVIALLTTAMISSSSQESVSAVSLINPLSMMIWAIFSAISIGGTVIIAQYKGRGDEEKLKKAAGQIILSTSLVAIVSCLVLIIFSGPLVEMMFGAADPDVLIKAKEYLVGVAISQIFLAIYMGAFSVFRGLGESKICLQLTIIINVLHLISSFVFINIWKLDILGTTLSLNIARSAGAIAAIWLIMGPKSILPVSFKQIFSFDGPMLKSIFKLSFPFALEQIFFNGGSMLVQTYIVTLGTVSVAANAIGFSAFGILMSGGLAVSTLATTVVGQTIGANKKDLAQRYAMKMIWLGTAIIVISIIVIFPFMPLILRLYGAPQETLSLIYKVMIVGIIPMPFFWASANILPSVLRSSGDALFTSTVSLITMWAIRVGLGYVMAIPMGLGVYGVWISMGIEWLIRSVIFYLRYRSGIWLEKSAIE